MALKALDIFKLLPKTKLQEMRLSRPAWPLR